MKKFLMAFLCTLLFCIPAYAVEVPWGLLASDHGDVVIGSVSTGNSSGWNLIPPGTDDWGYAVITEFAYRSSQSSTVATWKDISVSLDSEGYFVIPAGSNFNPFYDYTGFKYVGSSDSFNIDGTTPAWIWIDMYITNSSGNPVSLSVIESTSVRFTPYIGQGNNVSLAPNDNLVYDSATGHLHGYLDFSSGIGREITSLPFYMALTNSTYNMKSYGYRISNIFFGKDKSKFTPPGPGSVTPPEPEPPSFEEQVLEDLNNIQSGQVATQEVIQDAVSGAVSDIDDKYSAAVNSDLDSSLEQAKDGFQQIEEFEESLFEDMAQYESAVDPNNLVFDGSIVSALGFVSHLWVDCFDQLGIWQPIITFPMFFGLALLVIGRGYQAAVSTHVRTQKRDYHKSGGASN